MTSTYDVGSDHLEHFIFKDELQFGFRMDLNYNPSSIFSAFGNNSVFKYTAFVTHISKNKTVNYYPVDLQDCYINEKPKLNSIENVTEYL